jgi:hypothetical protein
VCRLINEEKRLYIHKVGESYSDVHDQLPPPFGEHSKILNSVRASNLVAVHSNCSKAVCLAARTLLLQCCDLRQYHEVSARTILPNFIGNCREPGELGCAHRI